MDIRLGSVQRKKSRRNRLVLTVAALLFFTLGLYVLWNLFAVGGTGWRIAFFVYGLVFAVVGGELQYQHARHRGRCD